MIWATVSSQSCFCWLYRASPSLTAKNIINLISVLTIWWCPGVESCVVGRKCLLWPVCSLGKIQLLPLELCISKKVRQNLHLVLTKIYCGHIYISDSYGQGKLFVYTCVYSQRKQSLEFNISNINNKAIFYGIHKI